MAGSKRSTELPKSEATQELADALDVQAARIAGVVQILERMGDCDIGDALGVCRDTLDDINAEVVEWAAALRRL